MVGQQGTLLNLDHLKQPETTFFLHFYLTEKHQICIL